LVEPARVLVNARDDGLEAEGENFVAQESVLRVEYLTLPGEDIDEAAIGSLNSVPGAMIAVPSASPSGMGPDS
jgi:hypothetical protein